MLLVINVTIKEAMGLMSDSIEEPHVVVVRRVQRRVEEMALLGLFGRKAKKAAQELVAKGEKP